MIIIVDVLFNNVQIILLYLVVLNIIFLPLLGTCGGRRFLLLFLFFFIVLCYY